MVCYFDVGVEFECYRDTVAFRLRMGSQALTILEAMVARKALKLVPTVELHVVSKSTLRRAPAPAEAAVGLSFKEDRSKTGTLMSEW